MAVEPTAYEARWHALCAGLDAHPEIKVGYRIDGGIDADLADAVTAWTALAGTTGTPAPAGVADCFHRFRRLGRQWRTRTSGVSGEFLLTHLAGARPQAYQSWIDPRTGGERFPFSELRIIDEHPVSGTGGFTGVRLRPGGEPELWWSTIRYADWRLDLGYREYLDTLLLTRGAFDWQFLFTPAPLASEEFDQVRARLERTLDELPALFPGDDHSDLRRRFEERL
ncbi:hypothetical protein DZF91_00140 [Actinomadura logoneensis]|uniref:Uncharacterized protein n=1 Tax=Actinomadura logoneensis TaxID=2293572 RepID=A0A372JUY9_9ACTN|nr:hypothetical protein [Actinomadura logoneensis]RFU43626.1 hypothetical protein DZF91_00140 [Actinomadura logoneensis]